MFTQKRYLTAEEVAEVLTLKPSTILSWVQQNKIPFLKLGKGKSARVRFNPKIMNSWIHDQSRTPELKEILSESQLFRVGRLNKKPEEDFDLFAKSIREKLKKDSGDEQ